MHQIQKVLKLVDFELIQNVLFGCRSGETLMTATSTEPQAEILSEVSLDEYLKTTTQTALAESVGCHQTAISRLVREKRGVTVITFSSGEIELREVKIIAKTA